MVEYNYVALDKTGRQTKGNISAEAERFALEELRGEGLYPIKIKKSNFLTRDFDFHLGAKVSTRDISVFCRQFASMLAAGVTILEALGMLEQQSENKHLVKALGEARQDIMKGETLADAMRRQEDVFPELMLNMIAAGEEAGKLEMTFSRMADQFEKSAKTEGMIKKAAVYPIIVSIVALVVAVVMLVKVVPSFMETFDSMDMQMPALTLAVVALSDFLLAYWYLILGLILVIFAILHWYHSTEKGKLAAGRRQIRMPLFGDLHIKTISSLTARTLGTLLISGMTLVDALEIVARTLNNELFQRGLQEAAESIRQGVRLSDAIAKMELYPAMVPHMIGIGEETGDLNEMLEKLADYYDEEVEQTTQTVMAALEPMIILVMAGLVGILIAAVMAPMIAMYSNMGSL